MRKSHKLQLPSLGTRLPSLNNFHDFVRLLHDYLINSRTLIVKCHLLQRICLICLLIFPSVALWINNLLKWERKKVVKLTWILSNFLRLWRQPFWIQAKEDTIRTFMVEAFRTPCVVMLVILVKIVIHVFECIVHIWHIHRYETKFLYGALDENKNIPKKTLEAVWVYIKRLITECIWSFPCH